MRFDVQIWAYMTMRICLCNITQYTFTCVRVWGGEERETEGSSTQCALGATVYSSGHSGQCFEEGLAITVMYLSLACFPLLPRGKAEMEREAWRRL